MTYQKRETRTKVKLKTSCDLVLIEKDNINISAFMENISKGGASICFQEKEDKNKIIEGEKIIFISSPYIRIRATIVWSMFNNAGIMFDTKITDSIIEYYVD